MTETNEYIFHDFVSFKLDNGLDAELYVEGTYVIESECKKHNYDCIADYNEPDYFEYDVIDADIFNVTVTDIFDDDWEDVEYELTPKEYERLELEFYDMALEEYERHVL